MYKNSKAAIISPIPDAHFNPNPANFKIFINLGNCDAVLTKLLNPFITGSIKSLIGLKISPIPLNFFIKNSNGCIASAKDPCRYVFIRDPSFCNDPKALLILLGISSIKLLIDLILFNKSVNIVIVLVEKTSINLFTVSSKALKDLKGKDIKSLTTLIFLKKLSFKAVPSVFTLLKSLIRFCKSNPLVKFTNFSIASVIASSTGNIIFIIAAFNLSCNITILS